MRFFILVAAVFAAGGLAPGQQNAPEPAGKIKVEVNQVLVPVVVTDRHGHQVTELKARDFRIFEDGIEQRVAAFGTEEQDLAALPADSAAPPAITPAAPPTPPSGQVRRTYFICLDTLNSDFGNFTNVRSSLRKLMQQEKSPDSHYALVALGRRAVVLQNITADSRAMLETLDNKEMTNAIIASEPRGMAEQERELSSLLAEYCVRCSCAGAALPTSRTSTGTRQICAGKWARIESWAAAAAHERSTLERGFLADLRSLVEQLARQPGKRILIFVSDGFNLQPGRELFGMMAAYAGDQDVLPRNPVENMRPVVDEILRTATANNVVFYTLDSRGLYATPGGGFDASQEFEVTRITVIMPQIQQQKETVALENRDAMAQMAAETGGVFYKDSNDLLKGLRQAFADGREYYVLAYVSSQKPRDGKFHEIRIEVSGKNLVVRAKRGYWAPAS